MSDDGRRAVARALCRILEDKYPGTVWLPRDLNEPVTEGSFMRRLWVPFDSVGEGAGGSPSMPDLDTHRPAGGR